MNIRELKKYIKRFKGSGARSALNNLKVDLHARIAYPFGCFVVILIGLPFALMAGRRKGLTFASIGIALAGVFLFYVVNAVSLAIGKSGAIDPALAAWLAPALFSLLAGYLIKELFL